MSKKCTPLWREAHLQVNMCKTPQPRSTFGSWDVHAVVARSTFPSQNVKNTTCSDHFWTFRCRFPRQAQGIVHLVKSEQTWGFCSSFKGVGRRGTFELKRICKDAFSVAGAVQETCSSEMLGGPGAQDAMVRGRQLWIQLSIFEGSLRRIVSFLILSTWKIEEVSQNCFLFDVIKFKSWESLAELPRFCCQFQKLRKSRRIASFSNLQIDR